MSLSLAVTVVEAENVAFDATRMLLRPSEDLMRVAELSLTALHIIVTNFDLRVVRFALNSKA